MSIPIHTRDYFLSKLNQCGRLNYDDMVSFIASVQYLPPPADAVQVNAGADASTNLPTTPTLTGTVSATSPHTLVSHVWTLISKPTGAPNPVITDPTSLTTTTSGYSTYPGDYGFRLTGVDDAGNMNSDDVIKTVVYIAPQVVPGSNPGIQLPTNSGTLVATVSPGSYALASSGSKVFTSKSGGGTVDATTGAYSLPNTPGNYVFTVTGKDINNVTTAVDITIVLAAAAVVPFTFKWGTTTTHTALSEADINTAPNSGTAAVGATTYVVGYNPADSPAYLWFAEPSTETIKTGWVDTTDSTNFGNIGTSSDLYGAAVIVGVWRFYLSVFQTSSNPLHINQ